MTGLQASGIWSTGIGTFHKAGELVVAKFDEDFLEYMTMVNDTYTTIASSYSDLHPSLSLPTQFERLVSLWCHCCLLLFTWELSHEFFERVCIACCTY